MATETSEIATVDTPLPEHVDVLVIGAGLSGIGAACQLSTECPDKSYLILESRGATGGTWDLFRYPGIRSDSDMFTLGYKFRPWPGSQVLADGPSILSYMRETAEKYGVSDKIRLNKKVLSGDWSSADQRWTVTVEDTESGKTETITASYVHSCAGYYNYDEGYLPEFPGYDTFKGQLVHPQHWPEDLDYTGKRVVVIGSGATAVTLVPAMAGKTAHITMLQRSPTYILSIPATDPIHKLLLKLKVPESMMFGVMRRKNLGLSNGLYKLSRKQPKLMRSIIRGAAKRQLPEDYPVDVHFKPKYEPWDQRLCVVPDGDLYKTIRRGDASVVTGTIKTFNETGIELDSGEQIDADIIITATGLNLQLIGGATFTIDGQSREPSEMTAYKGIMFGGVPNLSFVVGYTNASWTLKADLASGYMCRVLNYMDRNGYAVVTPRDPSADMERRPMVDLMTGYVTRSIDELPKQGVDAPWTLKQDYGVDRKQLLEGPVDDQVDFQRPAQQAVAGEPAVVA